ncbi:MAG TPA: MurR/RpiR family transcriptional regulator [Enterococcus columbae]|nr:MurR/RpiR family transcriptional regulator [Enterococcus columbae]
MENNINLSKTEQKIDYFINTNSDKVGYMSIRTLAKEIGVSTASILRYIKKQSFPSYKAFQLKYREKCVMKNYEHSSNEIIECLRRLETDIFLEQLQEASELISSVDLVLFGGIGNNEGIAQYGARCFSNNHKFALSLNDPFYNLNSLPKNMLYIALSTSGESIEMIRLVRDFRSNHIPILAITANSNSTLSALSDLTLSYSLPEQRENKIFDMSSHIPFVYIIEKLANNLRNKV